MAMNIKPKKKSVFLTDKVGDEWFEVGVASVRDLNGTSRFQEIVPSWKFQLQVNPNSMNQKSAETNFWN